MNKDTSKHAIQVGMAAPPSRPTKRLSSKAAAARQAASDIELKRDYENEHAESAVNGSVRKVGMLKGVSCSLKCHSHLRHTVVYHRFGIFVHMVTLPLHRMLQPAQISPAKAFTSSTYTSASTTTHDSMLDLPPKQGQAAARQSSHHSD